MDLIEKLSILADAAKYDVACTSSGNERKNNISGSLGNAVKGGICHSFTADGRCVSLLKILLSNKCIYDCEYCVNKRTNEVKRASFTPKEIAYLTMEFYKRNFIEGLFLSSAVIETPDKTMELMIKAIKLLRIELGFNGYIHIKAIPGADEKLILEAGELVDRMSVNIELPSKKSLKLLAPDKKPEDVIDPMKFIRDNIKERMYSRSSHFVPAGQSTQMIIGATEETDKDILFTTENLYSSYKLKRVFYSAYVPTVKSSKLPSVVTLGLKREHRLYQADWLLRFYGFKANELLSSEQKNLNMDYDPKCDWAIRNLSYFPIEINTAPYEKILRIPGVGVVSAKKIIQARRTHSLSFDDLVKMRIVMKRAVYFITCNGKMYKGLKLDERFIKTGMLLADRSILNNNGNIQLSLFEDHHKALIGDL